MDAGDWFEVVAELALIGLFIYGIYRLTRRKPGHRSTRAGNESNVVQSGISDVGTFGASPSVFDPFAASDSNNGSTDEKFTGGGGDFGGGGASDSWGGGDFGGGDAGGGGGDAGGGSSD